MSGMSYEGSPARGPWGDEEGRLRQALCRIGALCYQRNFIVGADGNLSARMSDGTILITPAGAMKGFLEPQHLAHIDMQGNVLDDGPKCSSETGIHLVAYHERPDVKAMVHAHPPHAVAMTIAGIDLQVPIIPEIVVTALPRRPLTSRRTRTIPSPRGARGLAVQRHCSVGRPQPGQMRPRSLE